MFELIKSQHIIECHQVFYQIYCKIVYKFVDIFIMAKFGNCLFYIDKVYFCFYFSKTVSEKIIIKNHF